jgi:hypothetical protein
VEAWSKDRWDYFDFRKILDGPDFIARYCLPRLGFTATSPHLTSWCRKQGVVGGPPRRARH